MSNILYITLDSATNQSRLTVTPTPSDCDTQVKTTFRLPQFITTSHRPHVRLTNYLMKQRSKLRSKQNKLRMVETYNKEQRNASALHTQKEKRQSIHEQEIISAIDCHALMTTNRRATHALSITTQSSI